MTRRGRGENAVYFDHEGAACLSPTDHLHRKCSGRWRGQLETGYDGTGKRLRKRVSGKTKTEVQDKLKNLRLELEAGVIVDREYRVSQCLDDWFSSGCGGVSASTITKQRHNAKHLYAALGYTKLADLKASDVEALLVSLSSALSTDTLGQVLSLLQKAINRSEINNKVGRNVAALIERVPHGTAGRESKSLSKDQAVQLIAIAATPPPPPKVRPGLKPQSRRPTTRMYAYILVSLLSGVRTEEARALRWDLVDLEAGTISVWRCHSGTRHSLIMPM